MRKVEPMDSLCRHVRLLSIGLAVSLLLGNMTACKPKPVQTSETKDIGCTAVSALTSFIGAIPIPGMSALSAISQAAVGAVVGTLKDAGNKAITGAVGCNTSNLADLSEASLGQIRGIVKDSFNEQNHMEAKATLAETQSAWTRFVPDADKFNDSTMTELNNIVGKVDNWWAHYDQSGTRIYNVHDFIYVTGIYLKALQQQVREAALSAHNNQNSGEAQRVRQYSENLSAAAHHIRVELQDIAEKDVYGMARAMYDLKQVEDGPVHWDAGIIYKHQNICYFPKNRKAIDPSRPHFVHETHSLEELSDWLAMYGALCCSFGKNGTCNKPESRIEAQLEQRVKDLAPHLTRVMFTENSGIQEYYHRTLPNLIYAAQNIKAASDSGIFELAGAGGSRSAGVDSGYCPDGDNGPGKGYGSLYTCGDKTCAKNDKNYSAQCIVNDGQSLVNGFCPDGDNGPGRGFGSTYQCGDRVCAKSDKSYSTQCTVKS